jgi:hypothetical protein
MYKVAIVAVSTALVAMPLAQAQGNVCFENYQCYFHHNVNDLEWSWDLSTLCQTDPANEYTFIQPAAYNQTFKFNVCGNTTSVCANGVKEYQSHGVAIQYFAAPTNSTPMCTDWDYNVTVPCTANCEVLGTEYFHFELIDVNNPATGGVRMKHGAMPPIAADKCPTGANGLGLLRDFVVNIACDFSVPNNQLVIHGYTESPQCTYLFNVSSSAGCGAAGDPYDPVYIRSDYYRDDPGHSFGFVVLGAVLTIIVSIFLSFGNARGWFDSVKDVLAKVPVIGSWFDGGHGYKSAGSRFTGGSTTAATPITASAYGSA